MSLNLLAVRTVKRHAPDDAQWLLDMLGLVDEDGSVPPDDTSVYVFTEPSAAPGSRNPDVITKRHRSKGLTTPPGLANLPPPQPVQAKKRGPKAQPKVIRPSRPREVPECGTYKKVAWHRRHEGLRVVDMDDDCQKAAREYGQKMTAAYRQRKGAN